MGQMQGKSAIITGAEGDGRHRHDDLRDAAGDLVMGRFVDGQDRRQDSFLPASLDDHVAEDNPLRRATTRYRPACRRICSDGRILELSISA